MFQVLRSWLNFASPASVSGKVSSSKVRSAVWAAVFVVRAYLRVFGIVGAPVIG